MFYSYNGVSIYYEYHGTGKLIVLLHGWGVDSSTFLPIIKKLEGDFSFLRLDFPGFGKSEAPLFPWSLEEYVSCLHEIFLHEKVTNPILLGHSFGGRVAVLYSEKYSVSQLILVSSAGIPHRSLKTKCKIIKYKVCKNLYKIFSKKKLQILQASSGSSDYKNASPIMKKTMSLVIKKDLRKTIKKISSPTLLLWGLLDHATPYRDGVWMHQVIKNSKLIVFYSSGHFCYQDEEEKFIAAIKKEGKRND